MALFAYRYAKIRTMSSVALDAKTGVLTIRLKSESNIIPSQFDKIVDAALARRADG